MNVFDLRDNVIEDYRTCAESFVNIRDEEIRDLVHSELDRQVLWPGALVQMNPSYEWGPGSAGSLQMAFFTSSARRSSGRTAR
jgi:hypothetical protein